MKLVFLGTGGYHPNERRHTACLMLPELGIVLDAGTGMFRLRERLATDELDIFLSHAHLDHVAGLTFLLGMLHGKDMRRVTIHGEADKLAAVREHLFHTLLFPVPPEYEFRTLAVSIELPRQGRLTHFPLEHPGGTVGYRLDWPDRGLAYVTDTTANPKANYLEAIRGVDVLVHECNFRDGDAQFANLTGHSHTTAVAQVAKNAAVGRLLLVHLDAASTEDDPIGLDVARRIFPNTEVAEDKMEIEF